MDYKIPEDHQKPKNEKEFLRYRWFFTRSGKLVYGGKNAEQNENIVNNILKEEKNVVVMHTRIPGSPFAIIDANVKKVNENDLEECAVWCACFSRAWRTGLKKTQIDVFSSMQIIKKKNMKAGTFSVTEPIIENSGNYVINSPEFSKGQFAEKRDKQIVHSKKNVELKLVSTFQEKVLRFVPEKTTDERTVVIAPGKITKDKFAEELAKKFNIKKEEALNALPTGGFRKI